MTCKFERILSSRVNLLNALLQITNSKIARIRDRFSSAENRRQQTFVNSIQRVSFYFERVDIKTAILHNEKMTSKMTRVIDRLNSTSSRKVRSIERRRE
jgi:hypothetical protein